MSNEVADSKSDTPFIALIRKEKRRVSAAAWALADAGLTVKSIIEGNKSIYAQGDYTVAIGSGLSTLGSITGLVFGNRADEFTIPAWIAAGGAWLMGGMHTHQYGIAFLGATCIIGQMGTNAERIAEFLHEDRPTQKLIKAFKKVTAPETFDKYVRSPGNRLINWYMDKALPWGEAAFHAGCVGLLAETIRIGINSVAPHISISPAVDQVMTTVGALHGVQLPTATGNALDGVLAASVLILSVFGNRVAGMTPAQEIETPLPRHTRSQALKLFEI